MTKLCTLTNWQFAGAALVVLALWWIVLPFLVPVPTTYVMRDAEGEALLPLTAPTQSQLHFGALTGRPHMYTFMIEDDMQLAVDIASNQPLNGKTDLSVIVVQQQKRGVTEVARILPTAGEWEPQRRAWGGGAWYQGGSLSEALTPGTYYVEVSAPVNETEYRLSVGTKTTRTSYATALRSVAISAQAHSYPLFIVLMSPYYYSLVVLGGLFAAGWWYRAQCCNRRRVTTVESAPEAEEEGSY